MHQVDCGSYMIGFIVLLEPIWMATFPAILQGRATGSYTCFADIFARIYLKVIYIHMLFTYIQYIICMIYLELHKWYSWNKLIAIAHMMPNLPHYVHSMLWSVMYNILHILIVKTSADPPNLGGAQSQAWGALTGDRVIVWHQWSPVGLLHKEEQKGQSMTSKPWLRLLVLRTNASQA